METMFVLIKSNFRDESEHIPIATAKKKEWLLTKIPNEYEEMEDEFIPTFMGKDGNYFEIRQCEYLVEEPYQGIELATLTKKKFKELADIHVYGRGRNKRNVLFFDWRSDHEANAVGFKYMVAGHGATKANLIKNAYDILVEVHEPDSGWRNDDGELVYYEVRRAKLEKDRFKVPISF